MSIAPWRSPLAGALERNPHPVNSYLQLATVRADGRPANRTVVFRGFLENTDRLKFVIDARSQKIEQIDRYPWAEACWYFSETREQFRISGSLTLVRADHSDSALQQARQMSWHELSNAARLQYTWPHPGEPRESAAFESLAPAPAVPLLHFCLLLLEPAQVDHLELRGEPQNRCIYDYHGNQSWSSQAINP
jgi:PPOX class probable FMN-dependent enzyme